MQKKTKPASQVQLPGDGERMVPEHHMGTAAYGDHIVRYNSVLPIVEGKVVLDIASGSGYGTQIIATKATKVYGVDIEQDAIKYAKKHFGAKNIEYKHGSGTKIPLPDASVDVVTSFETIEHIDDAEAFLKEVHRVLKPDGIAVVSTPNDVEFPEGNHFHVHEYTYDELVGKLGKYFKNIDSYYQGTWYYTAVNTPEMTFDSFDKELRVINAAPLKPIQSLFFFLVCSNRKLLKSETIQPVGAMAEHYSQRSRDEKELLTRQHIANLEEQLAAAKVYVKEREKANAAQIQELQHRLNMRLGARVARAVSKVKPHKDS